LKKVLIIGIGNDILTDDGIGPKLVTDLQQKKFPENIHFQNAFIGGLEILEMIEGSDQAIFIDAIITEHGIPGTIYQFTPADFKETLHLSNLHDANFLTVLEIGKKLNMSLPSEILIIAIEILEDRIFSDHFSKEMDEKYPAIYQEVYEILRSIL